MVFITSVLVILLARLLAIEYSGFKRLSDKFYGGGS